MAFSSLGIGSGLDIAGLVTQLVAAEGSPKTSRLNRQELNLQARLSGLGTFKGALSDFQTKLATLSQLSSYQSRSTSVSDNKAFTATATSQAEVGSFDVNISSLAQSHVIVTDESTPYTSTSDTVGTGELTIRFGTGPVGSFVADPTKGTHTITIDTSNNTLAGIRDALNEADIGIRASIINNGSGYLLSVKSINTGADNSIDISVSDTGDGNNTDAAGLSRLAYTATAINLSEKLTAQDASLTINGISITSDSNTVSDAIDGVTINLLDALSANLSISLNKAGVTKSINDFVSSYNQLTATISDLTSYDPETRVAGVLNGDAGVRGITSTIRNLLSSSLDNLTGPFTSLSGLGITTGSDGKLNVDTVKLENQLNNNFSDVVALFSAIGRTDDLQIEYLSSTNQSVAGNYAVAIDALATQGYYKQAATTSALADDGAGTFTAPFVVDADNDNFTIKLDGVTSSSISLTQQTYTTAAELAAEIQARINGDSILRAEDISVNVTFDSATDSFTISSSRYGSASKVLFTAVDTNSAAELGFDTALSGVDGVDVQGSIGGVAATGNGQELTGNGNAVGVKLKVLGGALGARGTIDFSRGIADQLNTYILDLIENDAIDDRIATINTGIEDIQDQREDLDQRLQALEARLSAKYAALDSLLAQLQSTSNFLSQQLDILSNIGKR